VSVSASIVEVLDDAQRRGFLGPGEIADFVDHALGYLDGIAFADRPREAEFADLGSGGGIPGLVLALELPGWRGHLVERGRARADWLTRSVARLGLDDRVTVHHEPAEVTGRGALRGACDVVVARSFARPAVAAECAAPLLRVGAQAVFSDLDQSTRWDEAVLGELGLVPVQAWAGKRGRYVALEQRRVCPPRFPRAPGVPARRPLV
jgi:16S rRNA (guanine527-N7)-methyltransferase